MTKLRRWQQNHQIIVKSAWSVLIVAVFLLGKSIPLPYTNAKSLVEHNATMNFAALATGGNLSQLSLFSLGLGPWMSAMIIASLLVQARGFGLDRMGEQEMDTLGKRITIVIALLEAVVMVNGMKLTTDGWEAQVSVGLVLIAGSMYCVWLSMQNARLGIGGPILLVLANMLQAALGTAIGAVEKLAGHSSTRLAVVIGALILFLVVFAYINVLMDRSEYRFQVVHLLIDNRYAERSYLPVKLTPAGGMAIMFAMALMALPTYLCLFLLNFWTSPALTWGAFNFTFTKPAGALLYIFLLFSLSMAFAYLNVNPEQQSRQLLRSGDYLVGIEPGDATQHAISQAVFWCGLVGALYNVILAGVPSLFIVKNPSQSNIFMLPGYVMMVIGFSMGMIDQVKALQLRKKYQPLFGD